VRYLSQPLNLLSFADLSKPVQLLLHHILHRWLGRNELPSRRLGAISLLPPTLVGDNQGCSELIAFHEDDTGVPSELLTFMNTSTGCSRYHSCNAGSVDMPLRRPPLPDSAEAPVARRTNLRRSEGHRQSQSIGSDSPSLRFAASSAMPQDKKVNSLNADKCARRDAKQTAIGRSCRTESPGLQCQATPPLILPEVPRILFLRSGQPRFAVWSNAVC